jgi:TadE-like protein
MTLVLGIVECARMYHAWETLTHASREAARSLALGTANPRTTVDNNVPGLVAASVVMVTTPTYPTACTVGSNVIVNLSYDVNYTVLFFPSGTKTVRGKATMRCGG